MQTRIRLGDRIGRGGMAEVFAAKLVGLAGFEKDVAVKRLLPRYASDPVFLERFLNEARLAARLSHPNIVQIFELGHDGKDHYIVMEAVRGPSLRSLLARLAQRGQERGQAMPVGAALHIARSLCAGLGHAHEQLGIIHRDVSPHNVVLSFDGAVKLIDFGIARMSSDERLTQVGQVIGKLRYMSPEQIAGEEIDVRSDLFAVGIILFEMLAGEHPYDDGSGEDLAARIREDMRPRLIDVVPGIDRALADAVERALAIRRKDRFPSVRAFDGALASVATERASGARDVEEVLQRLFADEVGLAWPVEAPRADGSERTQTGAVKEITLSSDSAPSDVGASAVPPSGDATPDSPADRTAEIGAELLPRSTATLPAPHLVDGVDRRRRELMRRSLAAALLGAGALAAILLTPRDSCGGGVVTTSARTAAADGATTARPVGAGTEPATTRPITAVQQAADPRRPLEPSLADAALPQNPQKTPNAPTHASRRKRPVRIGRLIVETRPWTRVSIDGRSVGETPLEQSVPVGRHRVLLENEASGVRRELDVEVRTNTPTILRLDLRK